MNDEKPKTGEQEKPKTEEEKPKGNKRARDGETERESAVTWSDHIHKHIHEHTN